MCTNCLQDLNKTYAFRERCIQSYITKSTKTETYCDDTNQDNPTDLPEIEPTTTTKCNICDATFKNKYLLKRHIKNVHATAKPYKCDQCEGSFTSQVYLNAHKRYHNKERAYICSYCGKGFITTSDLNHHEKIHKETRNYACKQCPKAFKTSSDLYKHKMCVHGDKNQWKHVCKYCDKRFPLKINLDTHVKTHTGERNFTCRVCGRRFINNSVLNRHMETHVDFVPFKCEHCLQSYKHKKSLDVHLFRVHGIGSGEEAKERVKKYCHVCPKSYFDRNKLEKHLRTHTGERPFKCDDCGKGFVDKSYVKQHMKTAHNILQI